MMIYANLSMCRRLENSPICKLPGKVGVRNLKMVFLGVRLRFCGVRLALTILYTPVPAASTTTLED
jgi:hypothetical protein